MRRSRALALPVSTPASHVLDNVSVCGWLLLYPDLSREPTRFNMKLTPCVPVPA